MTNKPNNFSIDARTILQLGRDSIKNPTTAVVELVKNSYDADATLVKVTLNENFIRIADNGDGMSLSEINSSWLRIGFSEKRANKHTNTSRRKTGEKGIGRLSTDRLGSDLQLVTKSAENQAQELVVNWDEFDVDGKNISDVPISISESESPELLSPKETGTEIYITNLRQRWFAPDVEQLYVELSALVSPFAKQNGFEIIFSNDVLPELNGPVESDYYDIAELSLKAKYDVDSNSVTYSLTDRYDPANIKEIKHTIKWSQLSARTGKLDDTHTKESLSCGPVELEVLFFPRSGSNPLLKEKGLTLPGLRNFLDKNAGIKIYRDDISVKPFGYNNEPAGDWLSLAQRKERDPAGLDRPTYKVSSYQLVGAVSIARDMNSQLRDGAAREGLVENTAFNDLRELTLSCVVLLEKHRYEEAQKRKQDTRAKTIIEKAESYSDNLDNLQQNLEGLSSTLKTESMNAGSAEQIQKEIKSVIEQTKEAKKRVDELLDNNRVLSGLATIGISAAVFGHETQTAISAFRSEVYAAKSSLTLKSGPKVDRALGQLDSSLGYAKQVSSWGAFAVTRVKKDKRTLKEVSVDQVVNDILDEIEDAFDAVKIKLTRNIESVKSRIFIMDIESIVLNLMTNAYAFSLVSKEREVEISLIHLDKGDKKGFEICVADSGPGIASEFLDAIWEPLFTTKKDGSGRDQGTGLGLSIVRSTVDELRGTYSVTQDTKLKGANFRIWLPVDERS